VSGAHAARQFNVPFHGLTHAANSDSRALLGKMAAWLAKSKKKRMNFQIHLTLDSSVRRR